MAELIVSPLLQVLFEKLTSSGINLYLRNKKKRNELPKIINRWKQKLGEVEAVLMDAEKQQFRSKAIQKWVHDLQDWAYDLEDILDEFATDVRLSEMNQELREEDNSAANGSCGCTPFITKVPCFLTCVPGASNSKSETYYSTKIEEINIRLEAIVARVETLNLIRQTLSREKRQEERTETSSLARAVFGRDDEKHELIQRLLLDEPCNMNYIAIPIVGQGGIGKTTLTQSVYNDKTVKAHFDCKAWVCVSDVFNVKQITTSIIKSANNDGATHNFDDLNKAQEKLRDDLAGKRFLIVLDDVWNDGYDPWEQLQVPFLAGSKGSKVIITTRLEAVAKNMLTRLSQNPIMFLKGLSDEECWLIFKEHALISDEPVETRDEVIKLCKGLPLAAKALGGLLKKKDRGEWSTILTSNIWSEEGGVLPVLRLSYYHLPQHLKRVFEYCSIFPKDHNFSKEDIVLKWMAEGFLPESAESMESNGRSYFVDLVSRSFFEPSSYQEGKFIMHDLIHDLAQWAASDVCCRMEVNKPSHRTRFMSVTKDVLDGHSLITKKVGDEGSQLRTFAFLMYEFDHPSSEFQLQIKTFGSSLGQFQCLRVLGMADLSLTELPNSIGDLKHLRLLDLSGNLDMVDLPQSVSKLFNLQTLLLKHCRDVLKSINMSFLIELRHLEIDSNTLMPLGIGNLKNLRTLSQFVVDKSGPKISELENLKHLCGSFGLYGLENVISSEDAKMARLNEKSQLERLEMQWGSYSDGSEPNWDLQIDVLDQLQPPESIKELKLFYYRGSRFPTWFECPSFHKMVSLTLSCLNCECLPPLGLLPSLKSLILNVMSVIKCIGLEFYGFDCSNPFPALKSLDFSYMDHLEEWLTPSFDNAFPSLEELTILGCPKLRGDIPSDLPSLKKLNIIGCGQMKVSLPSCPLLQELKIDRCEELSSNKPIICCSENVDLCNIASFRGVEGFWVPDLKTLMVVEKGYYYRLDVYSPRFGDISVDRCPMLLSWSPDVYGELMKVTHVTLGNCEQLARFLERKFPKTVKRLTILNDDSIEHVSILTKRSTSLEELEILFCTSLITINNLPLTLRVLRIVTIQIEQPVQEWGLHLLTSLKKLEISNAGSSVDSVESIPDPELQLPSSLGDLTISGFENLKYILFSSLPNLGNLAIRECPLMTKYCVIVPNGFKFKSAGGKCFISIDESKWQLQ